MIHRCILLLALAAVAVDGAATCESITFTGKGLCTAAVTEMMCIPDGVAAADYVTQLETQSAGSTKAACETAATAECVAIGGTFKSGYCADNGSGCDYDLQRAKQALSCTAAADCSGIGGLRTTAAKTCCGDYRGKIGNMCEGVDSLVTDLAEDLSKDLGVCAETDCISGASSLSISMALPALLAGLSMLFARF